MEETLLNVIDPYIAILSGLAAATGLIFTGITFLKDDKTRQIQTASEVINDIINLEQRLAEIISTKDIINEREFELRRKTWVNLFCNKLEWISFLILKKRITDRDVIKQFIPSYRKMVKEIFYNTDLVSKEAIEDKTRYQNIKQLYKKIKSEKLQ